MTHPAIRIHELGKRYRIGGPQEPYKTLRETLMGAVTAPARAVRGRLSAGTAGASKRDFWALKDITLDVAQGEVLGVIGRNGAGKTTLLKVLSRITEPTSGWAEVHGRVGSLLEVGTAFHPELSGRENIYLNGSILGMAKREIERKFDEIVAFAEIERFVDTPVKRYSSGMYVRLAFSVAAHLEPEILIIDEVLSVGDAAFQNKCLGKMNDVSQQGRTILFVSHNMATVNALCDRVVVLEQGSVSFDGTAAQGIARYLETQSNVSRTSLAERMDRQGDGRIRFTGAWIEDERGNTVQQVTSGQNVKLVTEYESANGSPVPLLTASFALTSRYGQYMADLWSEGTGAVWDPAPSRGRIECSLPRLPLNSGIYSFNVCGRVNTVISDWVTDAAEFEVIAGDFFGSGRVPPEGYGHFLFEQRWDLAGTDLSRPH